MLHINIITVGRNKEDWVEESVMHYSKLLKKYADLNICYLPDKNKSKALSEVELKIAEAALFEKRAQASFRVALTDRGEKYDSVEFAKKLNKIIDQSGGSIDFLIGGIYGLHDSILSSSSWRLSLSPMTMSHQLVRPVLLEQLFRAFSINSGGQYHK